jgi:hypothetical protein
MVPAVTYIYGDFTEGSLENGMSHLTFHVVSRLIEVTYTRNVVLARLANDIAIVANNH